MSLFLLQPPPVTVLKTGLVCADELHPFSYFERMSQLQMFVFILMIVNKGVISDRNHAVKMYSPFILHFSSADIQWRKVITVTLCHGKGQGPFDRHESMNCSMTQIQFCLIKRHSKNIFLHRRVLNKVTGNHLHCKPIHYGLVQ